MAAAGVFVLRRQRTSPFWNANRTIIARRDSIAAKTSAHSLIINKAELLLRQTAL
jgi:hypothetical protein